MEILHIAVLALVQGITEFLPISSSGHLILVPAITGWQDQGVALDVAVHVGTLAAVVLYFRRDLWRMILGVALLGRGEARLGARLALQIVLASLPVVGAGYLMSQYGTDALRNVVVIGWTTLGFGVLLFFADRYGMTIRRIEHFGYGHALIVGLAQVLALVPGTSRSGITMTAARALGYERADAARFSMLLSIPAIAGAGTLIGIELYQSGDSALTVDAALAGGLAFVTALAAITILMRWLRRAGFGPFVVYRIVLGIGLLYWAYA